MCNSSQSGGLSWPWSCGRWIYNCLCNQCLSPLKSWVQILMRARCTTLCDKVCQWLATGRWFSLGTPVSSTNKTDCHDITEILLKVALNTIKQTNKQSSQSADMQFIPLNQQTCNSSHIVSRHVGWIFTSADWDELHESSSNVQKQK
jgi:hypothetical protein